MSTDLSSRGSAAAVRVSRWQHRTIVIMAIAILIPSMYGFVGKFIELVHVFRGEADGAFAVAPIANYLLASAGFLCMLIWAAWNGMFRDIEYPKQALLDREAQLDELPELRLPQNRSTSNQSQEITL